MKTAISIPDEVFQRAERAAAELGMSRSEFYVSAVEARLAQLIDESVTAQINAALELVGEDPELQDVLDHNRRRLAELTADDEW